MSDANSERFDCWSKFVQSEGLNVLLGHQLGEGQHRVTYECAFSDEYVVKVETGHQSFQNICEWELWKDARDSKWARWFAPCVQISPSGVFLIQRRAEALPEGFLPRSIPSFFSDLKPENFGRIGRQVVAVDYGLSYLQQQAFRKARTRRTPRAAWRT